MKEIKNNKDIKQVANEVVKAYGKRRYRKSRNRIDTSSTGT